MILSNLIFLKQHSSIRTVEIRVYLKENGTKKFIFYLTGLNLSRIFNSGIGYMHGIHLLCSEVKLPSLELKTRPKIFSTKSNPFIKIPCRGAQH
jgi:hypothetical protein